MSGQSIEEIAKATGMSASAVRRAVGQAIDARRLDRPERYAKLQIARLTKALRSADAWVDQGELGAIEPFLKVVAALDRYHGSSGQTSPAEKPARRSRASRVAAASPAPTHGARRRGAWRDGLDHPLRSGQRPGPATPETRAKEVVKP